MIDECILRQRGEPRPQRGLLIEHVKPLGQLDEHRLTDFPGLVFVTVRENEQESVKTETVKIVESGKGLRVPPADRESQRANIFSATHRVSGFRRLFQLRGGGWGDQAETENIESWHG